MANGQLVPTYDPGLFNRLLAQQLELSQAQRAAQSQALQQGIAEALLPQTLMRQQQSDRIAAELAPLQLQEQQLQLEALRQAQTPEAIQLRNELVRSQIAENLRAQRESAQPKLIDVTDPVTLVTGKYFQTPQGLVPVPIVGPTTTPRTSAFQLTGQPEEAVSLPQTGIEGFREPVIAETVDQAPTLESLLPTPSQVGPDQRFALTPARSALAREFTPIARVQLARQLGKARTPESEAAEILTTPESRLAYQAGLAESRSGLKPGVEENRSFRVTLDTVSSIEDTLNKVSEFQKTGKFPGITQTMVNQFLAERPEDIPGAGLIPGLSSVYAAAQRAVSSAQTPESRAIEMRRAVITSTILRAMAGLAQTGIELSNLRPFTPQRTDTEAALVDKLNFLNENFANPQISTFRDLYPALRNIRPEVGIARFRSEEEAAAAASSGRINVGDKVIVNGIKGTWQ